MMTWLKEFIRTRIVVLVLTLIATSFLVFPIFPISQKNSTFTRWLIPAAYAQVDFLLDLLERTGIYSPPQKGTPPSGRQSGGAGRGPICTLPDKVQSNDSLLALMPFQSVSEQVNNQEKQDPRTDINDQLVGGLTISERPTFWFFIPYVADPEFSGKQQRVAQFVLLDETNHPVLNELISAELRDTPRLVEYLLPYTLETDELYTWYFTVICDSEKLSRNPVVRGWVQRIEPTAEVKNALDNTSRFEQYLVYAENGIWFETINSLANIRRQFPNLKREEWVTLLKHFTISDANQFNLLEGPEPTQREIVNGNQLPARM
ncbi:MAG: DUF928 domain-containing protein [Cyanobacteria bacterium P01_H01_bin.21]